MSGAPPSSERVPNTALDQVTLHDLDGIPFALGSLRGRRAVVFCFASW